MRIQTQPKMSIWTGEVSVTGDRVTVPVSTHGIADLSPSDQAKAVVKQVDSEAGGGDQVVRTTIVGTDVVIDMKPLGEDAAGDGIIIVKIYR